MSSPFASPPPQQPPGWNPGTPVPPPPGWAPGSPGWMYPGAAVPPGYPPPGYPPPGYPPPAIRGPGGGSGVGAIVAAALTGGWAVLLAVLAPGVATWLVAEARLEMDQPMPRWVVPLVGVVAALLVAAPTALLATIPRSAAIRAVGRSWSLAALALAALSGAGALPLVHNDGYLTLVALAFLIGIPVARLVHRAGAGPVTAEPGQVKPGQPEPGRRMPPGTLAGVAAGLACLLPWLWLAALGGVLDTILAVAAALAAALFTVTALDLRQHAVRSAPVRILVGGLVAGVFLTLIAAALGAAAVHLAELLVLPSLGFAVAALYPRRAGRRSRWAVVALLALAASGPLAFVDPQEAFLLLGTHDILYWTMIAALIGLGVALLVGLAYGLLGAYRWPGGRPVFAAATAALALGGAALYVTAGQPGLYGDELFVVMRGQADLSGLDRITDRDERLRQTYRRLTGYADHSQAGLRAALRSAHLAFTPYYLVNGIEVDGGPLVRAWLSSRSDVARVLVNPRLRPLPERAAPMRGDATTPTGVTWNIAMIGANTVWAGGDTGAGIVIGTSDSGVDGSHPALAAAYRGGGDSWYDPWNHTTAPVDHEGHGTHTMGLAVGAGGIGVAPGAKWMGCVNLDRNMGNPAYYLDCMQFMLAPFGPGGDAWHGDPTRAPDIMTNSWGCPPQEGCDAASLRPAVDALAAAGIYFVAAAGNSGPYCGSVTDPPAPYRASETVGAVDRQGRVTDFSSRGPTAAGLVKPDILAPGADVESALPGGTYGMNSGTSMATPQVAGVVALMWSANRALVGNIAATTEILRRTARPAADVDATGTPVAACGTAADTTGAGIVDAAAAVAAARAFA